MIEDRIEALESRVQNAEENFKKLASALSAACGDETAMELQKVQAKATYWQKEAQSLRQGSVERNNLLVELSKILKVKGSITTENLIRAAKQAVEK